MKSRKRNESNQIILPLIILAPKQNYVYPEEKILLRVIVYYRLKYKIRIPILLMIEFRLFFKENSTNTDVVRSYIVLNEIFKEIKSLGILNHYRNKIAIFQNILVEKWKRHE